MAEAALDDGVGAIDALLIRRESLERQMIALVPSSPWASEIARLRCLRGIDTLTALGLCAEIGDFTRFRRPEQLMSSLALVPSENTTDGHYRRAPRLGRELARRQDGQPSPVTAISWQAQRRLHRTWQGLDHQRGKRPTVVAAAVARELAGVSWAVTTAD